MYIRGGGDEAESLLSYDLSMECEKIKKRFVTTTDKLFTGLNQGKS